MANYNYSQFLQWALTHIDKVPSLISLAQEVYSAEASQKWEAFVPFGNEIDAIYDSFLEFSSLETSTEVVDTPEVHRQLEAELSTALAEHEADPGQYTQAGLFDSIAKFRELIPLLLQLFALLKDLGED